MLRKILILLLAVAVIYTCGIRNHQRAKLKPVETQPQPIPQQSTYQETSPPQEYHPPDRGFGTIDGAKDARALTNADTQRSEKAVQDTDQQ